MNRVFRARLRMLLLPPRAITGNPEVLRWAPLNSELGDLLSFRSRIIRDYPYECFGLNLLIWISIDSTGFEGVWMHG